MRRTMTWVLLGLVLGVGVAGVLVTGRDVARATPVIVDYSPTLSDVPALLYVAARPDVDLLAVTLPGTGESSCAIGVRRTRQLLALAGRSDVPVGCGREQPLAGNHDWPEEWRSAADTLAGPELPKPAAVSTPDAVDLLVDVLAAAEKPVTVLTLSSLTNLGLLVRDHPDAADGIGRIVTMGGAIDVLGNVEDEPASEWNLYIDPGAARLVLGSGIPVTLVALDATNDVPGNRRLVARARSARGQPAGVAAAQLWSANVEAVAGEGFYFWDELAAAAAFEPGLVNLETRTIVVSKDLGATVDDPGGTSVRLATSADQNRFEQHLLDTLNGSPVPSPASLSEEERAYARMLASAFDAVVEARKEAWRTEPTPDTKPLDVARAGVAIIWGGLRTLDETLTSSDPPAAYAEVHHEMRAALGELLGLEADAVAALDTPEAAAAEEPSLLIQAAVGKRLEEIAGRFLAPCSRIADDLLARDGPEVTCALL